MTYSQTDSRWSQLTLGSSPYSVGADGCLTTAIAQALALAGWTSDDPGTVCTELSQKGGYTDANYQYGPGLVIWNRIESAFPQFHWKGIGAGSGGAFSFVQVLINGRSYHWVLQYQGQTYDPLDGSVGALKANYKPTGDVKTADIDPAPAPSFPRTVTVQGPLGLRVRTEPSATSQMVDPDTLQPTDGAAIDPGNSFTAVDEVDGQDPFGDGRNRWFKTVHGFYVWNRDNQ